jgi:hypothetical protein
MTGAKTDKMLSFLDPAKPQPWVSFAFLSSFYLRNIRR